MKRSRPMQHVRKLRSGRRTIVNRGVRKKYPKKVRVKAKRPKVRPRKIYGFLFKSTNWTELAKESKAQKNREDKKRGPFGEIEYVPGRLEPYETLAFVDFDKGFIEMENKGVRMSDQQKRLIRDAVNNKEYFRAHELLPRQGKMFANMALNAEAIAEQQRLKQRTAPKTLKPKRASRKGSLPSLNNSNSMSFAELDEWLKQNTAKS